MSSYDDTAGFLITYFQPPTDPAGHLTIRASRILYNLMTQSHLNSNYSDLLHVIKYLLGYSLPVSRSGTAWRDGKTFAFASSSCSCMSQIKTPHHEKWEAEEARKKHRWGVRDRYPSLQRGTSMHVHATLSIESPNCRPNDDGDPKRNFEDQLSKL